MAAMTAEKFLESCKAANLKLKLHFGDWHLEVIGGGVSAQSAKRILQNSPELCAQLIVKMSESDWVIKDLLEERAAIRAADGLPGDLFSAALANITRGY